MSILRQYLFINQVKIQGSQLSNVQNSSQLRPIGCLKGSFKAAQNKTQKAYGTGVMIDSKHVLISAHQIYSRRHKQFMIDPLFVLGNQTYYQQSFNILYAFVPQQFKNNNSIYQTTNDFALLVLDAGDDLSIFFKSYQIEMDYKPEIGDQINIVGYLTDQNNAQPKLKQSKGEITNIRLQEKKIDYNSSTDKGMSGSPIILQKKNSQQISQKSKQIIIGIHTTGHGRGSQDLKGTKNSGYPISYILDKLNDWKKHIHDHPQRYSYKDKRINSYLSLSNNLLNPVKNFHNLQNKIKNQNIQSTKYQDNSQQNIEKVFQQKPKSIIIEYINEDQFMHNNPSSQKQAYRRIQFNESWSKEQCNLKDQILCAIFKFEDKQYQTAEILCNEALKMQIQISFQQQQSKIYCFQQMYKILGEKNFHLKNFRSSEVAFLKSKKCFEIIQKKYNLNYFKLSIQTKILYCQTICFLGDLLFEKKLFNDALTVYQINVFQFFTECFKQQRENRNDQLFHLQIRIHNKIGKIYNKIATDYFYEWKKILKKEKLQRSQKIRKEKLLYQIGQKLINAINNFVISKKIIKKKIQESYKNYPHFEYAILGQAYSLAFLAIINDKKGHKKRAQQKLKVIEPIINQIGKKKYFQYSEYYQMFCELDQTFYKKK